MKNLFTWCRQLFEDLSMTYWNVRLFFKNVWVFRKELAAFRRYDYCYNLNLFTKSLEETANFLDSNKSVACSSVENAEEIRTFVDLLTHSQHPDNLAEARIGYAPDLTLFFDKWNTALDAANKNGDVWVDMTLPERTAKDDEYHVECDRIEKEMWDEAWNLFIKRARHWWD